MMEFSFPSEIYVFILNGSVSSRVAIWPLGSVNLSPFSRTPANFFLFVDQCADVHERWHLAVSSKAWTALTACCPFPPR